MTTTPTNAGNSNSDGKVEINRPLIAALAVVCLLIGAIWWYLTVGDQMPIWPGVFMRIGMFLGALWVALPTRTRPAAWAKVSPWTFAGLFLIILMFARNPRIAITWLRVLVPLLAVVSILTLILRPKPKDRPQHRQ
ncbi:MAG: hypothetical protein O2955_08300 [Planctomycetota bacterium]|nr:hypothetical protein [Planctomycetota bacterium]MDA1212504.1 hypothetical protein [Planctomycetota bacterium]